MKMKKATALFLALALALGVTACGGDKNQESKNPNSGDTQSDVTKIALLLPYTGDQSYLDVTANSKNLLEEMYGDAIDFKVVEMGTESADWDTANLQAAEEGYDIIISGNWQYEGAMLKVAANYPDIKYLNFDYSDAAANSLDNVYGITYAAHEVGYLAGVVAAVKSQSGIIGGVGGADNNGIWQFMGGYIQGASDVNPDIKVIISYVGDFIDATKGKELTQNMINEGADVIWGCAGGAGNGVFAAAAENEGIWAIGVDGDQYLSMSGQPDMANTILTSALKKCDVAIANAVTAIMNGTAPFGTQKVLGYADDAVGLAENDYYLANMTDDELARVNEFASKVESGETTVIDELTTPGVYQEYLDRYSK